MLSNCLFEVIKAKIKDPKNVKIHLYPPEINHGKYHFYWENNGRFFHYIKRNPKAFLLFEGKINEYPPKAFFASILHRMYINNFDRKGFEKLIKKYHLPLTRDDIESTFFNEEND